MVSMTTGRTQVAAVIGDPITHSLSPIIHNAAFAALDLDWTYVALPVANGNGAAAVEAMRTLGISGLNVTMPHKAQVAAAVDRQTAAAVKLGACNCVFWDGNTLVGDNTDGDGFVSALQAELGVVPSGMRVVVLGAGGAARAIVDALARHGADSIMIVNRSAARAVDAANVASVAAVGSTNDIASADLIVNATSVGMGKDKASPLDTAMLKPHHLVADIVYDPISTQLLRDAASVGATTIGGLGMLVHQAAASFQHFTGQDAPIKVMSEAISSWLQTDRALPEI